MGTRTSRVLHRSLRETPPKAIGGEGVYLFAEDGRRVLDAFCYAGGFALQLAIAVCQRVETGVRITKWRSAGKDVAGPPIPKVSNVVDCVDNRRRV